MVVSSQLANELTDLRRLSVALIGKDVANQGIPPELRGSVQSLVTGPNPFSSESSIDLAVLLDVCPNLRYLHFFSRTLAGLPSRVGHPLPKLRHIHLSSDVGIPASDRVKLLNLAPNLRNSDHLPSTLHLLDDAVLERKKFDRLNLEHWRHDSLLLLLVSGRWTTRALVLRVSALSWRLLARLSSIAAKSGLQHIRDLTLILPDTRPDAPALILPLISACRIRRL
ncbi:hypothetical protein AURDEDRAFT_166177 [Auricularia subglabra TFB-10046 SS5]|nr:hypothetical protein AURDEDRAFT_166177 [Auricularia subglabra TFB-10046 SS5]